MRHKRTINHLSRKSAHRKAMLANMASSLILHKRINTTLAKAKALRSYIEPLITKSKDDNTHSRRVVFSYLQNKEAVAELFRDVSTKVADRPGGYTRIIKIGARLGDSAEMCMMELVDYNENLLGTKDADKGKSTRRRKRGVKKAGEAAPVAAAAETAVKESPENAAVEEPKVVTQQEVGAEVEDAGKVQEPGRVEEPIASADNPVVSEEPTENTEVSGSKKEDQPQA